MAIQRNTAEGGSNGVAVSTANSGSVSGDAWSTVSVGGSSTITFSNAQAQKGTLSYAFGTNATDAHYVQWLPTAAGSCAGRLYLYLTGVPSASNGLVTLRSTGGGTTFANLLITNTVAGSGGIIVQDAAGANIFTGSGTLATGTWYRVEFSCSNGNTATGTFNVDFYSGDGTTPLSGFTAALTGRNFGTAAIGSVRFGRWFAAGTLAPFYIDDVAFADSTTTYLGPSVANVIPTFDAGADITTGVVGTPFSRTATAADSDGTVTGYDWSFDPAAPNGGKPVGSTMTLTGATTATVGGTPDLPGVYVIRGRAQDNVGAFSLYDSFAVYVPGNTISVYQLLSNPGGWTLFGTPTPADIPGGLNDVATNTTGATSATVTTNPSILRLQLNPLLTPTVFPLQLDHLLTASGAGTAKVRLIEGSTTRKEWVSGVGFTAPTTTQATGTTMSLTSGEIATVTSWTKPIIELEWGV